jgi:hypothetical protein
VPSGSAPLASNAMTTARRDAIRFDRRFMQ